MKEEKNESASSCGCAAGECCGGTVASRKTMKIIICLIVVLAVVGIVAYKLLGANNSCGTVCDDVPSRKCNPSSCK